ncbi:MAG: hypothetical protein IPG56_10175 [Caulobacteraceae bacterium]|nr:hypothetical protein [Caulobacteraceae bacterium]
MSNAGGAIVAIRLRKERQIAAALIERSALSSSSATAFGVSQGFEAAPCDPYCAKVR